MVAILAVWACLLSLAHAQTVNIWTNTTGGYWETAANWSAGAPSSTQSLLLLTNAGSKTARLFDGGVPDSAKTISNLVVSAPAGDVNTLQLETITSGTNQFQVLNGLTINSGGGVLVASATTARVDGVAGGGLDVDGSVRLLSGSLITSNTFAHVGSSGFGSLTVDGGAWRGRDLALGYLLGASGTLTQASGSTLLSGELRIGPANSSTGAVYVTGGRLTVTNAATYVSLYANSVGTMTVTNALWQARDVFVGYYGGTRGKLFLNGGTNTLLGSLTVGDSPGANGTLCVGAGQLLVTNPASGKSIIGNSGLATATISNCLWQTRDVYVGRNAGSSGDLDIYSGTNIVSGSMVLGDSLGATGAVTFLGGSLSITNPAGDAKLIIGRDGTGDFTMWGGTLVADTLLATNKTSNLHWVSGNLTNRATTVSNSVSMGGGTWTMLGGIHHISTFRVAWGISTRPAFVSVFDGQLTGSVTIGGPDDGTMLLSNVNWTADSAILGDASGNHSGKLTILGGVSKVRSLTVGFVGSANELRVSGGPFSAGTLTVASGTSSSGAFGTATFTNAVWNAGRVVVGDWNGAWGGLYCYNSTGIVTNQLLVGLDISTPAGTVWVASGELAVTNAAGTGLVQIGSGTGASLAGPCILYIAGGTVRTDSLVVSNASSARSYVTGKLAVRGGTLNTRSALVHNGLDLGVGASNTPSATWLIHDGVHQISSKPSNPVSPDPPIALKVGPEPGSTGSVVMASGLLLTTNGPVSVGDVGTGSLTVSNGTWLAGGVVVGNSNGAAGSLNVYAGTVVISSNLTVGYSGCGSAGSVLVSGGQLLVTNATHDATLEVRSGAFNVNGGTVVADRIVVTNACGRLIRYGGALQYGQLLLAPNLSANGDAIPNSWKQQYGLDPFLWNIASLDSDGDGMSNQQEYLAGTNPTNANSVLRITRINKAGNDVQVVWKGAGPRTNHLQVISGIVAGVTNAFQDIGPAIVLPAAQDYQTTNWDTGGGSQTGRFYRIRVGP